MEMSDVNTPHPTQKKKTWACMQHAFQSSFQETEHLKKINMAIFRCRIFMLMGFYKGV